VAVALLASLVGACARQTLVVVDPDPCADAGVINGVPGCVPRSLLEGLVGFWRLDEAPGSTIANDLSGYANDATLVNLDPATAWVVGRVAGGLAVEGAGFGNVVPSASIDSITDQVTVAGWAYLDGTIDDFATVASRQVATSLDQHYHISINSRGEVPALFIKTENGQVIPQAPTAVVRQTWLHIAGTYDGSASRLYVDGKLVASMPLTGRFVPDTTPFILGGNGNGAGDGTVNVTERFPGRIDEIMLYRRALSADEIAMLHDGALFPSQYKADGGARD
jgi:large repetitive protein